ncbi:MAG: hypothetical protein WBD27_15475 [Pyrinomonadaceae bacterium]
MKLRLCMISILILASTAVIAGQQPSNNNPNQYDPNAGNLNYDVARIAASVQTLTKTFKEFVDKFAKVDGLSLGEKQQKLVVGMQLLIQNEQRVATLQKFQIDMAEKESQIRSRLAQIDLDLNPQSIDRSLAFEGSTQTPEIKENKRRTLQAERNSLQPVLQQIQNNLQDASYSVREAQALVQRLRRTFLPQIERELAEQ